MRSRKDSSRSLCVYLCVKTAMERRFYVDRIKLSKDDQV